MRGLSKRRVLRIGVASSSGLRDEVTRVFHEFAPFFAAHRTSVFALGGTFRALERLGVIAAAQLHQLRSGRRGGVVDLTALVVGGVKGKRVDAVLFFSDPREVASLFPESIALKRECVVHKVPFLSNEATAREWFSLLWKYSAREAASRYFLSGKTARELTERLSAADRRQLDIKSQTLALIAHDAQKRDMLEFSIEALEVLDLFARRIATGTTGGILNGRVPQRLQGKIDETSRNAVNTLRQRLGDRVKGRKRWVRGEESGPKGGDVQVANDVLNGVCQKVFFFEDAHIAREHEVDIQLLERTCRLPESKVVCFNNRSTASAWASMMRDCARDGVLPITLHRAFQACFGVDLFLVDPVRAVPRSEVWARVVEGAGTLLVDRILGGCERMGATDRQVHVVVNWGPAMDEVQQRMEARLRQLRRSQPTVVQCANGRIVALPLIGLIGSLDPRAEASDNAGDIARHFSGRVLGLPSYSFVRPQQRSEANRLVPDEVKRGWKNADFVIFTCNWLTSPRPGQTAALPPRILSELTERRVVGAEDVVAGGVVLDRSGRARDLGEFYRVGMPVSDWQACAKRGGAVLVVGGERRRAGAALACIRGGLVSTVVCDLEVAREVIRLHVIEA